MTLRNKTFIRNLSVFLGLGILLLGSLLASTSGKAYAANTLYVNGYNLDKSRTYNMWIVIQDQWGNTVETGFTPLVYSGIVGVRYTVFASDYDAGGLYFDHWGNGSTSKSRSFTMGTSNVWFDVYYRSGSGSVPPASSSIDNLIPKTGVFVALYMYPGGTGWTHWQKVIDAKAAHPSVPVVAVINPSSGPGSYKDWNFANGITKLRNVGVIVLGYTYDDYGTRSISALKGDVDKYVNWYGIDGVFIDEFTNRYGYESHYREVTNYAKSRGMKMTMGNPGTDVPQSYIGTVDVLNITEGRGYMPISWLQYCINCTSSGWHDDYNKRNFAYIRYDIDWLDQNWLVESSKWVGLAYIHSGDDSNGRWFNTPPWLNTMFEVLDR